MRIPSPHVRLSFQVVVEYGVMAMFALFLCTAVNKWVGLLFGLMAFSSFFPVYTKFTFVSIHGIILAFVWYYIVFVTNYDEKLLDAVCIVALANVAFLIMQYFNVDPLFVATDGGPDRPVGMMANRNDVSALLAVCSGAFLRPKRYYGLIAVLIGLVLAKTSGGFIAVGIGVSFFLIMKGYRFIGAALPFVAMILYVAVVDKPSVSVRWEAWTVAWQMYLKQPWIGYGLGHWKAVFPVLESGRWMTAHCDPLQGLFEMGLLFPIIVFGYFVSVGVRLKKLSKAISIQFMARNLTSLVIIIAISCASFPMHLGTVAIIAVTLFSITEKQLGERECLTKMQKS